MLYVEIITDIFMIMLLKDSKAIAEPQKKLLRKLMDLELLSDYCLVGGTNLAFRYERYPKSFSIRAFAKRPYIT